MEQDKQLNPDEVKVYTQYVSKLNTLTSKKKKNLFLQLKKKIKKFNRKSNRKLVLLKNGNYKVVNHKRSLVNMVQTYNNMGGYQQPQMMVNPNYNMGPNNMNMQNNMNMNMQNNMNMYRQNNMNMGNNPNGMGYVNMVPNRPTNQANRGLFIEGLVGGVGQMASGVVGSATGAVKGAASSLGANGGSGAALLGAGAGLAMATMGKDKERNEISDLEQDVRNKEFHYFMQVNKKNGEIDHMEHGVRSIRLLTHFLQNIHIVPTLYTCFNKRATNN